MSSNYGSSSLSKNMLERDAKKRLEAQLQGQLEADQFTIPQNVAANVNGLPLMVELVVDSQIKREPDVPEDYYSHTGNSWNQSDIDEAYENYYSSVLLLPQEDSKEDKESSSSGNSEIKTAKKSRRNTRKKRAS